MKHIKSVIQKIKDLDHYPDVNVVEGVSSVPEITIKGKNYIQFCSANYLGMMTNKEVIDAIKVGFDKYGIHPAASRLVSGTQDIHVKLENEISRFKGTEDAMIFPSGITANIGTIPAIVNIPLVSLISGFKKLFRVDKTIVLSDEFNHASIIDGVNLSKAKKEIYEHINLEALEKKLKKHKRKRKLIISDGVFSMNGDIAPLKEIIDLAKSYNAMIMVDDAHGTGILGKHGTGSLEHMGIDSRSVDINMGTFSKAFGIMGGFIAGEKELIDYLRVAARTYVFTGGFPGGIANGIIKSIEIVEKSFDERKMLWDNSIHLRGGLQMQGYNTLGSMTPIIPILIGSEDKSVQYYRMLLDYGIFAPNIRWPAVKNGESIVRFSVTSLHSKDQIDKLLEATKLIGRKLNII